MKSSIMAAIALSFSLLAGHDAVAAICPGVDKLDGFCRDRELVALRQAGEAKLKRLMAAADPLTAMLMRRDQRWFLEIVHGENGVPFGGKDDPERLRMKAMLEARLTLLDRFTVGAAPEGPAGQWLNTLGSAKVEKRGDGLAVTLIAKPDYGFAQPKCGMTAELELRPDGWYVGMPVPKQVDDEDDQDAPSVAGENKGSDKDADDPSTQAHDSKRELRLRLQGNSLRVVVTRDDGASYGEPF